MIRLRRLVPFTVCCFTILATAGSPSQAQPGNDASAQVATPNAMLFPSPRLIEAEGITELQFDDQLEAYIERADGSQDSLGISAIPMGYEEWRDGAPVNLKVVVSNREDAELLAWIPRETIAFKVRKSTKTNYDPAVALRYLLQKEAGAEGKADSPEAKLGRFLDSVINEDAVEVTSQFVRNTAPLKSALWDAQRESQRFSNTTTLRVFLEQPEEDEKITLKGFGGIKMYTKRTDGTKRSADGMYHEVETGEFSGTQMYGSGSGQLQIGSPYHYPAAIEVSKTTEIGHVLGEFMLRRPAAEETAEMRIKLTDADNNPVTDWKFAYGPITWGGPYGYLKNLSEEGTAVVEGLAPQSFLIGFLEKPIAKDRTNVELKPGQIATIRFQLDAEGKLQKPDVSYEPRAK